MAEQKAVKKAKSKKSDPEQQLIPGAMESIREEIARQLRLGKEYETLRMENGREEKKAKDAARALMEQHNIEDFVFGTGSDKVHGFFEETKKIKIRVGDEPDDEGNGE